MTTKNPFLARWWAVLTVVLSFSATSPSPRAADASPPSRMSYQGYVTDGSGVALGNTNTGPRNYTVIFRIYDASTAGNKKWSEQQTVTVDKGYFSVVLGEGSPVSGEPNDLVAAFADATASDRYMGITVGTSEIAPRLQLLTSPYSFTAKYARGLVDNTGTNTVVVSGNLVGIGKTPAKKLDVNGEVNATKYYGDASALTGIITAANADTAVLNTNRIPSLDATKITTGTLDAARIPNLDATKITTGTLADARLSANVAKLNASQTFSGTVTATSFSGYGVIPVGGIIMWSGATVPTGWALCDGSTVNGQTTPDLRGRFVLASGTGSGLATRTLAQKGGEENHTLTINEMPAHTHNLDVNTVGYIAGYNGSGEATGAPGNSRNNATETWIPYNSGGGAAHNNMPPYYVLAFIMRVQ